MNMKMNMKRKRSDIFDPRLKLIWCLTLLFTALLSPSLATQAIIIALVFFTDLFLTGSVKKYSILLLLFLIVASQLFLMQLLFNREGVVIWQWGILEVYSGALPAALLGLLRTVAVSLAAIQMMTWTPSEDAVLMLIGFRVPYRYAMLITMAARFLPLLKEEYASISDSQAVRGVAAAGLVNRVKMMPLTVMPFLYRALRRTSEIALSMELRGFGKSERRTFSKELHLTAAEIGCCFLLPIAFIVLNFYIHI
ncbi:MAG TPA: energy-coupling factor transporter transmembrane component T [Clostridiales bacterium]|nr:energy-coupling factor transporter transmembrane component T [Clostridiales bacterium]